jgi:SAM-dependent methyltransferase
MYSENRANDVLLIGKAFLSNQLARFAPSLYVKLTHQTGRGSGETSGSQDADYFIRCFTEYFEQIGLNIEESEQYLKGKKVLEYGPGDILGMALLMYAHGAETVHCVDRFPLEKMSEKNLEIYNILLGFLEGENRVKANNAFRENGKPESGFNPNAITYSVVPDGLVRREEEYDFIISRAVLEHVNDLEKTLLDIGKALKKGGTSIHEVDLKSHGLDRYQTFDFLTWPDMLYRLMYSHKGYPNRWRVDKYKEWIKSSGLRCNKFVPTEKLGPEKIDVIMPKVAKPFRHISAEELSWLGFWMVLER